VTKPLDTPVQQQTSKFRGEALTFDDVLLVPAHSQVLPKDVDTRTRFSRNVTLNVPVSSSAMDTVTETQMAIAMARHGGVGVIHKKLGVQAQAEMVTKVKRSEAGMIVDPITLTRDATLQQAEDLMREYRISGVPVTEPNGRLVGILTNRDLRFETDYSKRVEALMTKDNLVTVPVGTTLEEARDILKNHKVEKLLVVDAHYTLKGLITIKDITKKLEYPLAATRVVTGVGMPQLTAIMDVTRAAAGSRVPVIADGGIKMTGDLPKAIAAGADCVMVGSMLAGTTEAPGEDILRDGRRYKTYRGMGSLGAMAGGSADRYFQEDAKKLVPEGIEGMVAYKGPVGDVLYQMLGGLRSAMGYCGTEDLAAMQARAQFVTITQASLIEGHPHDVTITKDAPNYSRRGE
jgi:IMP dehydrogenase